MVSATPIKLARLSYVIYEHPSLDDFRKFAVDFGFEEASIAEKDNTVFYHGYGVDPFVYVAKQSPNGGSKRFIGAGFAAESEEDYKRATKLDGAEIIDTKHRPGGGQCVCITDPNGFSMLVEWGQEERKLPEHGISSLVGRPAMNGTIDKERKGEFTRMRDGPAKVHKLGHFGYTTDNFEATCSWYQNNFNLVPTEVLYSPKDENFDVATFFRLDRGKTYVDHHCFLLARNEKTGTEVHHSSFEVEDIDTQFMGHQWLAEKGYDLVWGIGRHVHGSQVFDYWYDVSHFIIEHYADGDVVNEDTEVTPRSKAGNMAVWGPPVPDIWGHKQKKEVAKPMNAVSG